jgi:hypothetical protein
LSGLDKTQKYVVTSVNRLKGGIRKTFSGWGSFNDLWHFREGRKKRGNPLYGWFSQAKGVMGNRGVQQAQ